MILSPALLNRLVDQLMTCGVSPFNIGFNADGLVVFYSNGLTATQIADARHCVECYLLALAVT